MKYWIILVTVFFSLINSVPTSAQTGEEFDYHILVDFGKLRLYLTTPDSQIVRSYPVALPYFKMNLPVEGKVVQVVKNPWWFPTEKTRRSYFEKYGKELPVAIPPGDSLNAMGSVKIIIHFFEKAGTEEPLRIHGTNNESSITQRATRGCIRMLNKNILELSELTEEKKTKVLFVADWPDLK